MLGLTPDMYADVIAEYDITPVVCDSANAKAISDAAAKIGKTVFGLIAIDTGMGRIGYLADEIETSIEDIKKIALCQISRSKACSPTCPLPTPLIKLILISRKTNTTLFTRL